LGDIQNQQLLRGKRMDQLQEKGKALEDLPKKTEKASRMLYGQDERTCRSAGEDGPRSRIKRNGVKVRNHYCSLWPMAKPATTNLKGATTKLGLAEIRRSYR